MLAYLRVRYVFVSDSSLLLRETPRDWFPWEPSATNHSSSFKGVWLRPESGNWRVQGWGCSWVAHLAPVDPLLSYSEFCQQLLQDSCWSSFLRKFTRVIRGCTMVPSTVADLEPATDSHHLLPLLHILDPTQPWLTPFLVGYQVTQTVILRGALIS